MTRPNESSGSVKNKTAMGLTQTAIFAAQYYLLAQRFTDEEGHCSRGCDASSCLRQDEKWVQTRQNHLFQWRCWHQLSIGADQMGLRTARGGKRDNLSLSHCQLGGSRRSHSAAFQNCKQAPFWICYHQRRLGGINPRLRSADTH